jgi:protein SCO1/2
MKRFIPLAIVVIAGLTVIYFLVQPKEKPLPIINPVDVNEEMVDPDLLRVGFGHKIGDFSFQNQYDRTITQKEVEGKVYVAEYFFTTCKSICPVMNKQMQRVYKAYKDEKDFAILSYSVDPDTDTVEQMKRYADDHGVSEDGKWHFLTGDKVELYELARKSYFVLKPAEAQNLGDAGSDFIHTNNFVLVDRESRIRGYYDGTNPEEVDQLIHDIEHLIEED